MRCRKACGFESHIGHGTTHRKIGTSMFEHADPTSQRSTDPRVLEGAKALRKHFSDEDSSVSDFPDDEFICCAEEVLKAAGVL